MGQAYSYEVGKRRVRAYLKKRIRDYEGVARYFYNHGLEDGAQSIMDYGADESGIDDAA